VGSKDSSRVRFDGVGGGGCGLGACWLDRPSALDGLVSDSSSLRKDWSSASASSSRVGDLLGRSGCGSRPGAGTGGGCGSEEMFDGTGAVVPSTVEVDERQSQPIV
jgi:hypothetical protein